MYIIWKLVLFLNLYPNECFVRANKNTDEHFDAQAKTIQKHTFFSKQSINEENVAMHLTNLKIDNLQPLYVQTCYLLLKS